MFVKEFNDENIRYCIEMDAEAYEEIKKDKGARWKMLFIK